MSTLFSSITIANKSVRNRIVMPPMDMSLAVDGHAGCQHMAHYVARSHSVGLEILEASAIAPEARIASGDLGIWDDSHVAKLANIAAAIRSNGATPGIQINHAGRKGYYKGDQLISSSPIAFDDKGYTQPKEATLDDIKRIVGQFGQAAARAKKAGMDYIEIHGAHGYLISQFLSPITNKRSDEYGKFRGKFLVDVIKEVRSQIKHDVILGLRISAVDYPYGEGNKCEDMIDILQKVKSELGSDMVDVLHVSTGGVANSAPVGTYPGFQVKYATAIKQALQIPVIAGGMINSPELAEFIVASGQADMVFIGRGLLNNSNWGYDAAKALMTEFGDGSYAAKARNTLTNISIKDRS